MKINILFACSIVISGCSFWSPPAGMDPDMDPPDDMTPPPAARPVACDAGDTRAEDCRTDCRAGDSYWICTGGNPEIGFSWECVCAPEASAVDPEPEAHACEPGTIRLGDCAEECAEGSSFRACLATASDFAWTCVVHNPAGCQSEVPPPAPAPEPTPQDRTVSDDPDARIIVTVAGLDDPVTIRELVPVTTDYVPTGADGILQTTFRARFRESDGRLRFQIWQNGRPLSGVSAGECVTIADFWQIGTHDEATGRAVECFPEMVDGVCAFTIPRFYRTYSYNTLENFLLNARYQLGVEDPPETCVATTEICGNGIDEDCDGFDRSCPPASACGGDPLVGASCHAGLGECRRDGRFICDETAGLRACSVTAAPAGVEICNGLDDDCDGVVDDGVCGSSTRRLRIEMRVQDTSASTWGTARNLRIVNDDGFATMTCDNTGSTAMQSLSGGWYMCEVTVPTGTAKVIGLFESDRHPGTLGSTTDWASSSCYGTDGVTVRVYDAAGTLISGSLGRGADGVSCRHVIP